jgi:hypothetical protein
MVQTDFYNVLLLNNFLFLPQNAKRLQISKTEAFQ